MATYAELLRHPTIRELLLAREPFDFDQVWQAGDVANGQMRLFDLAARAYVTVRPGEPLAAGGPYIPDNLLPDWMADAIRSGAIRGHPFDLRGFGAKGDAQADDTEAARAWVAAARNVSGYTGAVAFASPGVYRLTDTVAIDHVAGFVLRGAGASDGFDQTMFLWDGPADRPAFVVRDCSRCYFGDFELASSPAKPMLVGVQIENVSGGSISPKFNYFQRVIVNGTNDGGLLKAGFYHAPAGVDPVSGLTRLDANNDFSLFDSCVVSNHDNCGWLQMASQSKGHVMYHCDARPAAGNTQAIGVSCGYDIHSGATANGGSFHWEGGGFSRNKRADFFLQTMSGPCTIRDVESENSARMIETAGPASASMPVIVDGYRWAHAGNLNADLKAIRFLVPGPLLLNGLLVQSTGGGEDLIFEVSPGGSHRAQVTLTNSIIGTNVATIDALFSLGGTVDLTAHGNILLGLPGNTYSSPDNVVAAGGLRFGKAGPKLLSGAGTPEGAVTAPVGSAYLRTDGGAGTTLYVKQSGTGNTGWVGK